jgi:hypothetical protein
MSKVLSFLCWLLVQITKVIPPVCHHLWQEKYVSRNHYSWISSADTGRHCLIPWLRSRRWSWGIPSGIRKRRCQLGFRFISRSVFREPHGELGGKENRDSFAGGPEGKGQQTHNASNNLRAWARFGTYEVEPLRDSARRSTFPANFIRQGCFGSNWSIQYDIFLFCQWEAVDKREAPIDQWEKMSYRMDQNKGSERS